MVKFQIKANPSGQYYFPKEVRAELGRELTLVCNAKAAVVFSDNTGLAIVLESLDLIAQDLRHRLAIQENTEKGES